MSITMTKWYGWPDGRFRILGLGERLATSQSFHHHELSSPIATLVLRDRMREPEGSSGCPVDQSIAKLRDKDSRGEKER